MIDLFVNVSECCRLVVPEAHKRPIAIIGAGGVVDDRHGIPHVYAGLDELLADDLIEVVDIAVPVTHQPPIFRAAVTAGKHFLAQKPFTDNPHTARELAALAAKAGGVAAVTSFTLTVNVFTDWSQWKWARSAAASGSCTTTPTAARTPSR